MQQAASFGRRGLKPAGPMVLPRTVSAAPAVVKPTWSALEPDDEAASDGAVEFYGAPVFTLLLLAVVALLFWGEQAFALSPPANGQPSYLSLMAMGGVSQRLVFAQGEVWRLFTAPWLHANVAHLVGNSLVLGIVGFRLERLVRSAWFLAIYMASALGGSLASAVLNGGGPVSVGASGAIMGLLGACLTLSFHAAAGGERTRLRILALRLLIPALLPTSGAVDYGCHIGGALTGGLMGLALKASWPETAPKPALVRQAGMISATGAALGLAGLLCVVAGYGGYARRQADLAPDVELQQAARSPALATDLAARFSRDPRPDFLVALADTRAKDWAGAEAAARAGLADGTVLDRDLPPLARTSLQALLAADLVEEGRPEEARAAAAPLCRDGSLRARSIRLGLRKAHLCG